MLILNLANFSDEVDRWGFGWVGKRGGGSREGAGSTRQQLLGAPA